MTCNFSKLAEILQKDRRTIYGWAEAGMPYEEDGQEKLVQVHQVVDWLVTRASGAEEKSKQAREALSLRKLKAETETAEMERDEVARKLLPAGDVERTWSEHSARIRDRFLSLPDRLADQIAHRAPVEAGRMLYDEIEKDLNEIVDSAA